MTPDYSLSGLKLLLLGLGKTSLVQLIGQQLNFTKQFVNISPHKYRGMQSVIYLLNRLVINEPFNAGYCISPYKLVVL